MGALLTTRTSIEGRNVQLSCNTNCSGARDKRDPSKPFIQSGEVADYLLIQAARNGEHPARCIEACSQLRESALGRLASMTPRAAEVVYRNPIG